MRRARAFPSLLAAAAVLAGCRSDQLGTVGPFEPPEPPPELSPGPPLVAGASDPEATTLWGWDGSPVGSAPAGVVRRVDEPAAHPLEESGGSRLVLLDLYQRAVEERDEYLLEVEAQHAALEQAEQRAREQEARYGELRAAHDALAAENQRLAAENLDLAARLTTAQIRRLEAEKAWLEAAIESEAIRAMEQRDAGPEEVPR